LDPSLVRELPADTSTAGAAARAVDAPLGSIVKSLVFLADGAPLLVLVAGDQRADVRRLRAALGLSKKRLRIAQPAEVLDITGFEVGGVPPVGHDQRESRPKGVPEHQRSGGSASERSESRSTSGVGGADGAVVRTLIDRTLGRFDVVWAAAGSPNAVFPIAYSQLEIITNGEVMDLVEES
jgi:prolyl-tRNA editing enzyme YbaK/EbsC (Cys-tRNA(Pro) deacylase)